MGTQEKEKVHADEVQERLGMNLEQIEILRMELVGTELDDPPGEVGVITTHAWRIWRRNPTRGGERRRFGLAWGLCRPCRYGSRREHR